MAVVLCFVELIQVYFSMRAMLIEFMSSRTNSHMSNNSHQSVQQAAPNNHVSRIGHSTGGGGGGATPGGGGGGAGAAYVVPSPGAPRVSRQGKPSAQQEAEDDADDDEKMAGVPTAAVTTQHTTPVLGVGSATPPLGNTPVLKTRAHHMAPLRTHPSAPLPRPSAKDAHPLGVGADEEKVPGLLRAPSNAGVAPDATPPSAAAPAVPAITVTPAAGAGLAPPLQRSQTSTAPAKAASTQIRVEVAHVQAGLRRLTIFMVVAVLVSFIAGYLSLMVLQTALEDPDKTVRPNAAPLSVCCMPRLCVQCSPHFALLCCLIVLNRRTARPQITTSAIRARCTRRGLRCWRCSSTVMRAARAATPATRKTPAPPLRFAWPRARRAL